MHLLPSRGRPVQLQRFFDEGNPEQPGVVITEEDQSEVYCKIRMPPGWQLLVVTGVDRLGYAAAANAGFRQFPNEPWYGQSGDDSIGRTAHWDTLLGQLATPNQIVWPNDLFGGRCTQPFVGGDLVRALGWFAHPALGHLYTDTVWGDIQQRLGSGGYHPEIVYEHLHWCAGKAVMDRTAHERKISGDELAYRRINWQDIMEKVKSCVNTKTAGYAERSSAALSTSGTWV